MDSAGSGGHELDQTETRPPSRFARLADRIVAAGFASLIAIASWIPHRLAIGGARRAADLAHAAGLRRRVLQHNLDLVYGRDVSAEEKTRIARSATRNIFLAAVETLRVSHPRAQEEILSQMVFEPRTLIDDVYQDPRGCVMVVAHSGNFDLCGLRWLAEGGPRVAVVMKPAKGHSFNAALVEGRRRFGFDVLGVREPGLLRQLVRRVNEGWVVCLLPDQHARRSGVVVDFLGQPASTHLGAAFVALKARDPRVIVAVDTRVDDGPSHVCHFKEISDFERTGDTRADVTALTQRFNDVMEETIEKHPGSYLWHHRRWRAGEGQRRRETAPVAARSEARTP
jgi:KDO2-lipid IV(A) lauroyltransferase